MSSPLLWFGNAAKFLKSQLIIPAATSGQLTLQPAATTTSYSLTMPSAQGTASTVLTNDGSGNLSWSAPNLILTTFTLADNQTSLANITGFSINPSTYKAFLADTLVNRYHTNVYVDQEDTTFTTNVGAGFDTTVYAAVIQPSDSKVLLGGAFTDLDGSTRNYLVRLNQDGTEDTSFYTNLGSGFNGDVFSIGLQSTGKIIVAGNFTDLNGNTRNRMVRLNSDGTEDSGFYTNLGSGFNLAVLNIYVQSDDKILVGGTFTDLNGNTRNRMVRLNSDGTEDTSFYTNLGTGFNSAVYMIKQQSTSDIIVVGNFTNLNGNTRNRMVRLDSAGVEDTGFYTNLGTGFNLVVETIAILGDDSIATGGLFNTLNGNTRNRMVLLNDDGTENTTFYTNLGTGFGNEVVTIELANASQLLVGGVFTTLNGNTRNHLVRLNNDGTEDVDFYTSLGGAFNNTVNCLAVEALGPAYIGGSFSQFNSLSRGKIVKFGILVDYNYISQGTIKGVYNQVTGTWMIAYKDVVGNDTGVSLQMTNAGQLQYTSTQIGGTLVDSYIKFSVVGL